MTADDRYNQACVLWDKRRLKEAFRLFLSAAEDGDLGAQLNIGYFYDYGLGTKKDSDEALRWYRRAHRRGHSSATLNIGTVYRDRGDTKRALQWFERALARGNDGSALDIGKVHLAEGNLKVAAQYFERVRKSQNVSEDTRNDASELLKQIRQSLKPGRKE
jgi:TPR repeat protein